MTHSNYIFAITLSLIAAFLLNLLPMPGWAMWLRPAWILMVLIFWTLVVPYRVNVGIAWLVGIALDVLNGTLFGAHALAFVVVIYFVARFQSRLRMFPLLQQGLCVFLLILFSQFILYCIQGFINQLPESWLYWLSAVTSMLLWPWVYIILSDFRRRFRVG